MAWPAEVRLVAAFFARVHPAEGAGEDDVAAPDHLTLLDDLIDQGHEHQGLAALRVRAGAFVQDLAVSRQGDLGGVGIASCLGSIHLRQGRRDHNRRSLAHGTH
jgi:hypothetical protein